MQTFIDGGPQVTLSGNNIIVSIGKQGPAGIGLPAGGSAGKVLKKKTGSDYDVEWGDVTAETLDGENGAYYLSRANHTGTQSASTISDFDVEVSNNPDVSANTSARHTHTNKTILDNTTASFTTSQETKLAGIETLADVTDAANVGSAISGTSTKVMVDADSFTIIDSEALNTLKRTTLSSIKSVLSTFFSSVYASIVHGHAISDVSGLQTALDGKQASLGFTPEDSANKSTSVVLDGSSDTKYPSVKAIKDYADGLVTGLLDYRGGYDASGSVWPSSGGSGTAGAVMKGDMWVVSVSGSLGGLAVQVGDSIIANTDSPGQAAANWNTLNANISYVPEDSANKSTSTSLGTSDILYPTQNAVKSYVDTGLSGKETTISSGTTAQYWRGDKTWQTLDKSAVGLSNVENTALSTWTGSSNITTVGTISSGTWSGSTISVTKGGTGTTEQFAQGAIVFAGASGVYSQDASLSWDSANKCIGVGGSPSAAVNGTTYYGQYVAWNEDGTKVGMGVGTSSDSPGAAATTFGGRTRGTLLSKSIVQNGDYLSAHYAVGWDGTDFAIGGTSRFEVDSTPGTDDMPTAYVVALSGDGAQNPVEKLRVASSGIMTQTRPTSITNSYVETFRSVVDVATTAVSGLGVLHGFYRDDSGISSTLLGTLGYAYRTDVPGNAYGDFVTRNQASTTTFLVSANGRAGYGNNLNAGVVDAGPILTLTITNGGSGYTDGSYTGVSLTNISASGAGAIADFTVSGGVVAVATISHGGRTYYVGDTLTATIAGGSGLVLTVLTASLADVNINSTSGGVLRLKRADSTITADELYGAVDFYGIDSSSRSDGVRAGIYVFAGNSTGGTYMDIRTAPSQAAPKTAIRIGGNGNISFIGAGSTFVATSILHLPSGTTTANTAPLKFTSGTNLTTPEVGSVEYDGANLYFTRTGTQRETLISKYATSIVSSSTPSPTGDAKENEMFITALATNPTFSAPSGTPENGNKLLIRVKDDGTSRTIAWNAIYVSRGASLPTSTTINKYLYIGFIYNSTTSTWDCIASSQEA